MDGLSEGELKLRARVVPAARGARWLADGWRFFRAAPIGWTALVFAYLVLMILAMAIPVAGALALAVLTPPLSVSFMAVARAASRGAPIELALGLEGFRLGLRSQIALGFIYGACIAAIVGVSGLLLGELPAEARRPEDAGAGLAVIALMYVPVMMLFWFAPILAAWHDVSPVKAMFFSIVSCWRNRGAFIVFGALWFAVATTVSFGLTALMQALGAGDFAVAALMPATIIVTTMLYCSFYATYRGCFGVQTSDTPDLPTTPAS